MNLSGLMDTVRNALGLGAAKPAAPAPKASALAPAPAPRPAPAALRPVTPSPVTPSPVTPAPAAAGTGGATLVRAVRAGGRIVAAGTAVKVVTVHGKGTAYTVQLPGLATAKTIEGAAIRVG